jgi:predicted ArsR family transcriptional regulator
MTLARSNDPLVSFLAADLAKSFIKTHEVKILATLESSGPLGVDAIACRIGLSGHQVGKRMTALKLLGLICLTGNTVQSSSGRCEREWAAL